jgi:hypothetical protein
MKNIKYTELELNSAKNDYNKQFCIFKNNKNGRILVQYLGIFNGKAKIRNINGLEWLTDPKSILIVCDSWK